MLRSHLCDYSDVYTLDKETITLANTAAQSQANSSNKRVILKTVLHLLTA